MTAPFRIRTDVAHRADEVWRNWRTMRTAPPIGYVDSWHIRRQHNGTVHIGFTTETGWAAWGRYLGLDLDTRVLPNSWIAAGEVDGVRFVLTCPHTQHDEAGAA